MAKVDVGPYADANGLEFSQDLIFILRDVDALEVSNDKGSATGTTDINHAGYVCTVVASGTDLDQQSGTVSSISFTFQDGGLDITVSGLQLNFADLTTAIDDATFDNADSLVDFFSGIGWELTYKKSVFHEINRFVGTGGDDTVTFGNGDDVLMIDGGSDKVDMGGGDDHIDAYNSLPILAKGASTIDGGKGYDTFSLLKGENQSWFPFGTTVDLAGKTTLFKGTTVKLLNIEEVDGSLHDDKLLGDTKANTFFGGAGKDTLVGRGGADMLTGGADQDTFVYQKTSDSAGKQHDMIDVFISHEDKIDLSALHPDTGNDKFSFIGAKKFSGDAGELHVVIDKSHATAMIEGDLDGDKKADFQIEFDHFTNIVKGDFIL